MMFGFDISSMSAFIGAEHYMRYFNSQDRISKGSLLHPWLWVFFGSIASSFVSEPFGRRLSLLTCAFFWMVGAAIQSSVQIVLN